MALGFIKRIFTFGKEEPADIDTPAAPVETAAERSPDAIEATEDSALSSPIPAEPLPQEERAEAPATPVDFSAVLDGIADLEVVDEEPVVAPEIETAAGPSPDMATETTDEAEYAASPPSVPAGHLPHKGGDQTEDAGPPVSGFDEAATTAVAERGQEAAARPISPRVGEMSAEPTEGGDPPQTPAEPPILPKGFATATATDPVADAIPEDPGPKRSWYQRLRDGLARTSSQLSGQIAGLFTKRKLDDATLQDLEDLLIQADLGVETALRITDTLASERYGKDVSSADVARIMAGEITKVLSPVAKPLKLDLNHKPHVILVVGVNGTGKTTTIGKLAAKLSGAGLKVMMAAGDTFRAAAIEQLKIWADRTGSVLVSSKLGADAAGLAYEAFEQARLNKSDVLIIDTAGRLQNKTELMAELEKIVRVLGKLDPDAPHTVLQTLDATTGQNAMNQVDIFRNVAGVNGLIMTKLDGTARGGILVAIAAKHRLPVYFIGVGEGIDDLEPFEAKDFADAIAGGRA